jgi:uncharacterized GH25 family protein
MNKILLIILSSLTMISQSAAHRKQLNPLLLDHSNGRFAIIENGKRHEVDPWNTSKEVRNRPTSDIFDAASGPV